MVRGAAALLALTAVAQAYVLVAPALPAPRPHELAVAVAAGAGVAVVVAMAALPAASVGEPLALAPALLGGALVVAPLAAGDAGAAATPAEALLYGALGVLFASLLDAAALVVALPLFVVAVDALGLVGGGSNALLSHAAARGDPLILELPAWGGGAPAGRATVVEAAFVGAYAAYARRFALRPSASVLAMLAALVAAVAAGLALDSRVPLLAVLSGAFLAVNADRIAALLRAAAGANVPAMELEEQTLERVGDRCEECGARLTERELQQVIESGGPALCTVHAAELVAVEDDEDPEAP